MRTAAALAILLSIASSPAQAPPPVPLGTAVDAAFHDGRWLPRTVADLGATAATVVFFATIKCPIVQRYLPRLGELAADHAARGVRTLVVNVGAGDLLVDAAGQVVTAAPAAVFGKDFDGSFARACGVDRTGTALVLDRQRRIVYRGRVDDQYGYTGARPQPSRDDLRLALEDVLAGRPVAVAETAVLGCRITAPAAAGDGPVPTFARDVLPLLQKHCQDCHRPGGEGPFALLDETDAKKHAAMIAEVVEQGRMPLWYGDSRHGAFVNRRAMTAPERETIVRWVAGGMPGGEPADLPRPRDLPDGGWRIGEPDLVISLKGRIQLPPDGVVPYQYFVLPYRFDADTWVEAIEIKPENPRVLHHCNLARVKLGERFSQDGFLTGYVPGGDPHVLDPGTAVRIPAGSALALQAHYVTIGEAATDRISVGLRFPRVPVQKEMQVAIVANTRFSIPPGALAHPVAAARTLRDAGIGIGLFVHMHLRGRDMTVVAEHQDGARETLLVVPNYHFDWQQSYRWAPGQRTFAAGTKVHALAHYDNSAWNPFNPDPAATVRFGLETEDEMMYLFLFWVKQAEALGLAVDPRTGHVVDGR